MADDTTRLDPFEYFDAAYLFGALDVADRADYEAHLPTCAACRARLDELRPTVTQLEDARADVSGPDPAGDPVDPPDALLPGLLRQAAGEQRRRRWASRGLAGVAAACVAALVIALWPGGSDTPSGPAPQALQALRPVPVTATATLADKPWGTQIRVLCKDKPKPGPGMPYRLVVIDRDDTRHDAGSWRPSPTGTTRFTGGTEVTRDRIVKVEVTLADGKPILQLTV